MATDPLAHDLVEFSRREGVTEARMVYCRRCGATQAVEAGPREPLGPCLLSASPETALREALGDVRREHRPNERDSCVLCRTDWPCSAELLAELVVTLRALTTDEAQHEKE